jgi:hypothetical protein
MIKKIVLATSLVFSLWSNAQDKCGFDKLHRQQLSENPVYTQSLESFEKNLLENPHSFKLKSNGSYKIPLVIHVMETKTSMSQISDEQIYAAIQNLNEVYRKVAGTHGDGNGVDLTIEFALAVRDPQGNCTTGITRRDMTSNAKYMAAGVTSNTDGISDATIKALDVWDQTKYYNIWLVSEIDNNNGGSGTQGYAYFASSHGYSNDGAIILVNAFKDKNDHTLPHELGHSLNLYHTFEGDQDNNGNSICPTNTSCLTNGDKVCDTPPHKRSKSDCVIGTNSCDGGTSTENFIHNYMDYSSNDCANMFTAGQKTRMLAALTTTRASFLEENGNVSLKPVATPTVDFIASNSLVCTGSTVNFKSRTSCIPNSQIGSTVWTNISFKWTLTSGATVLTSTLENPSFQLNTQGTYDATLEVTSSFGTQTLTKPGFIIVSSSPKTACTPTSYNVGNFWNCVTNVTLNDINNTTSLYDNVAYSDFSCSNSTILEVGKSYDLTVSIRAAGYPEVFEAYIDYNNNGVFEIGEKVHSGSTPMDTVNFIIVPIKTTITIPQNAVLNTPLRMRVYGEANTLNSNEKSCTSNLFIGDIEDYAVYIKSSCIAPNITVQPTIPTATCSGSGTQTLSVTALGNNLVYQWRKGGVALSNNAIYSGVTTSTLTLTNPTTAEAGNYDVLVSGLCSPSVISNVIPVTVNPSNTPAVTLISSDADNTICANTTVLFTATPINGGTTPTYQWKKNGISIPSETNTTYTTTSLSDNDQISVELTSNVACKTTSTALSTSITTHVVTFSPSVTIASSDLDAIFCAGTPVTFTATPINAGSVNYLWHLNSIPISNETNATFTSNSLQNLDVISVKITSLESCATPNSASSNNITVHVNNLPLALISSGFNTCLNAQNESLTLNPMNGVSPYQFSYSVNNQTPINSSIGNYTLPINTSNPGMFNYVITSISDANGCTNQLTGINANVFVAPFQAVSFDAGTISDSSLRFSWSAINGVSSYAISYTINSSSISIKDTITNSYLVINHLNPGSSVTFTVTPIGSGCFNANTQNLTTSSPTTSVNQQTLVSVSVYPNPTTGKVTIQGIPTGYTQLELIDQSGRSIRTKAIKNAEIIEEYSDITPGIYQLKFSGDNIVPFSKTLEINL